MATIHRNWIGESQPELNEFNGSIRSMKTSMLVRGLPNPSNTTVVMKAALDALDLEGFTHNSTPPISANLRLVSRTPKYVSEYIDEDSQDQMVMVGVELEYKSVGDTDANWVFHISATLQQTTSIVDALGQPVVLEHTYDASDPEKAGVPEKQVGEFQIFMPVYTLRARGLKRTNFPLVETTKYLRKLNSAPFLGANTGKLFISNVEVTPSDMSKSPREWLFDVEILGTDETHQPQVAFSDGRTGRPPYGLVPNVGFKKVVRYFPANFSELFAV